MSKEKIVYEEDDGEVVAPMNLEGMPWYQEKLPGSERSASSGLQPQVKLTAGERWAFFTGALKACLLVTLSFFGVMGLFILILFLLTK